MINPYKPAASLRMSYMELRWVVDNSQIIIKDVPPELASRLGLEKVELTRKLIRVHI